MANTKRSGPYVEFDLGLILPIAGIKYNPTNEWIQTVYRFYHEVFNHKKAPIPHYGGTPVEAVIMETNLELDDPTTQFCAAYSAIQWPHDHNDLIVFEFENGTLWEMIARVCPKGLDHDEVFPPGGSAWLNRHLKWWEIEECGKLMGPNVIMLYFVRPITPDGLRLHESRLPQEWGKVEFSPKLQEK